MITHASNIIYNHAKTMARSTPAAKNANGLFYSLSRFRISSFETYLDYNFKPQRPAQASRSSKVASVAEAVFTIFLFYRFIGKHFKN